MDLLLIESIAADSNFTGLLTDEIETLHGKTYEVKNVELSNHDTNLGESDITVIIEVGGIKYGFLIEDKINAVAMPNQYGRYVERAEKQKAKGIYSEYFIFIFCSDKYRSGNSEAKLYPYHLSYERCLEYFKGKGDAMSRVRVQQLEQAINKSKSSDIVINANANNFFKAYTEYQKAHFPKLNLTTKTDKNGYWPQYATAYRGAYILHKMNFGYVDLLIKNCADVREKRDATIRISKWLKVHGCDVEAVIEHGVKSVCIRYKVQPVDTSATDFNSVPKDEVCKWFICIEALTDIAALFENIRIINN